MRTRPSNPGRPGRDRALCRRGESNAAYRVRSLPDGSGVPAELKARQRCEALVEEVLRETGIPRPWDINTWVDRLERVRGRDIDLHALVWEPGEATGAWQARPGYDLIAYPANTAGYHQNHIILHEIGHMLFAHAGRCVLSPEEARRLAPSLEATAFAHLFGAASGGVAETEAELFAHLMHARIFGRPVAPPRAHRTPADPATAATVDRLTETFDTP